MTRAAASPRSAHVRLAAHRARERFVSPSHAAAVRGLCWLLCALSGAASCERSGARASAALRATDSSSSAGREPAACLLDRERRRVCVPSGTHRIACDDILCFESLWTLGRERDVVSMRRPTARWIQLAPSAARATAFDEPNLEQLLADRVDLAFVYYDTRRLDDYARAGITAVVAQSTTRDATDVERFLAGQKDSLRLYGQVLGPSAAARAQAWTNYVDTKVAWVTARTRSLTPAQRLRAYYVRGPDPLTTHGIRTCPYWYAFLAGVDFVTGGQSGMLSRSTTSAEQLVRWDPELVLVGRSYSTELVLRDERFATLRAVQHGAVHALPGGVFFWDGGPESILLMLWLAKIAHPQLFADLDVAAEVHAYYVTFYAVDLSDTQLRDLLAGRGPDGLRVVSIFN